MANASIEDCGNGKFIIHWRQVVDGVRKKKEHPVYGSRNDAEEMRLGIIRALDDVGHVDTKKTGPRAPATILQGLLDYVRATEGAGDLGDYSAMRHNKRAAHVAEGIHAVTRIAEDQPLPVTLLGRDLFVQLVPLLTKERGEVSTRHILSLLWRAWGWMADDANTYPHVPPCPRSHSGLVPKGKIYGRTVAPEIAHADACLRHLRAIQDGKRQLTTGNEIVIAAMIMRFTGLRVGTILDLDVAEIDLPNGIMTVGGKTKQEKEDQRPVPLSRHLVADPLLVSWAQSLPAEGRAFGRVSHTATIVRSAWEAATAAGEAPRAVWDPPNRKVARPNHGFRAALQAHMTDQKVGTDVIDHLVGHSGDLRATHYGRDLLRHAREAVDGLPPIDWTGPLAVGSNVVRLHG